MKDEFENMPEKLYSIVEVAAKWRTTVAQVAKVFKREPGVLPAQARRPFKGMPDRLHQRRIPSSILEKVESRLREAASAAISPSPAPSTSAGIAQEDPAQRLYSFNQIAAMLKIGTNNALQLFRDEPGVLEIAPPRFGRRKGHYALYSTPRVPEAVLQRVHARLTRKARELTKNDG